MPSQPIVCYYIVNYSIRYYFILDVIQFSNIYFNQVRRIICSYYSFQFQQRLVHLNWLYHVQSAGIVLNFCVNRKSKLNTFFFIFPIQWMLHTRTRILAVWEVHMIGNDKRSFSRLYHIKLPCSGFTHLSSSPSIPAGRREGLKCLVGCL